MGSRFQTFALGYTSDSARALHARRRRAAKPAAKLDVNSVAWSVVLTLLDWKWSPQQIAATLKRVFPNEPERHVSHETVYAAVYAQPRGELRRQLVACLRQGRSTRLPRTRGTDQRGQISDIVSIHVRPPKVEDRVMPGHWEGDFIKGTGNQSSVGCWWSAPAAWCCWRRWLMQPPPRRWPAFLPS